MVKGRLAKNEKFNFLVSKHKRKPSFLEGLTFQKSLVQDHLKTVKLHLQNSAVIKPRSRSRSSDRSVSQHKCRAAVQSEDLRGSARVVLNLLL